MNSRTALSVCEYDSPVHVTLNRKRLLNLNSFVIAEQFIQADLVPVWAGKQGFAVLGSFPLLEFRGAHIRTSNASDARSFLANKAKFRQLLQQEGISIARGLVFTVERKMAAQNFLTELANACVVKPAWGKQGQGVTVGVRDPEALDWAIDEALRATSVNRQELIIEQQFCDSEEARFLIVGGRCVGVFKRLAPAVCGDGSSTIAELVKKRNKQKRKNPNECRLPFELSAAQLRNLTALHYTPASVLPDGQWLIIDQKASISTGGDAYECGATIADDYKFIAEQVAKLASPIEVIGVDMMARNFSSPLTSDNYIVLEANSGPAITGHQFPSFGEPANVAAEVFNFCQKKYQFNKLTAASLTVIANLFVPRGTDPLPAWLHLNLLIRQLDAQIEQIDIPKSVMLSTTEIGLLELQRNFYKSFKLTAAALVFSEPGEDLIS
jgi:D-alanine-D-alanine ligase-like ATP-grasp enzyme